MRFENKIAIIAGGGGGIGRSVSLSLAAEGAKLIVWDLNTEALDELTKEIQESGGNIETASVNVMDYDSVKVAVDEVVSKYGRLDIMVACVGGGKFMPLIEYTPEFWSKELNYNLNTVFNCFHPSLKHMVEQQYGRLFCFISTTGGTPGLTAYGAAKAGCKALLESIAAEHISDHITANGINPGFTPTPFSMQAFDDTPEGKANYDYTMSMMPLGPNSSENVATTALNMLADDRLTGQILYMR